MPHYIAWTLSVCLAASNKRPRKIRCGCMGTVLLGGMEAVASEGKSKIGNGRDFPGGPVVTTSASRVLGFNPSLGNLRSQRVGDAAKKKNKTREWQLRGQSRVSTTV